MLPIKLVYLLLHEREDVDGEHIKIIGVFEDHEIASSHINDLRMMPGFKEHPDGFSVEEFTVGECRWTDGFHTHRYREN
jgi:hypothetical protein